MSPEPPRLRRWWWHLTEYASPSSGRTASERRWYEQHGGDPIPRLRQQLADPEGRVSDYFLAKAHTRIEPQEHTMTDTSIRSKTGLTLDHLRQLVAEASHRDGTDILLAKVKPEINWDRDPACLGLTITHEEDQ